MSEQPGPAAGTAEAIQSSNFHEPWSISDQDPRVLLNANGGMVALTVASPFGESPSPDAVRTARYIVACVNFCKNLPPELVEAIGDGVYKVTASRLPPEEFDALAAEGMVVSGAAL